MICRQKTTRETAGLLNLAPKTIEYHHLKILKKTGVASNIGIVLHALKYRLVALDDFF